MRLQSRYMQSKTMADAENRVERMKSLVRIRMTETLIIA
jgi:hypothetical protein